MAKETAAITTDLPVFPATAIRGKIAGMGAEEKGRSAGKDQNQSQDRSANVNQDISRLMQRINQKTPKGDER